MIHYYIFFSDQPSKSKLILSHSTAVFEGVKIFDFTKPFRLNNIRPSEKAGRITVVLSSYAQSLDQRRLRAVYHQSILNQARTASEFQRFHFELK